MERRDSGLFQIGEVSRMFHVSVSTLRHYDKLGLVKPEYTDPDTGYRYYSTRQFECLNTIRYLRALDMPLERIAGFLGNRNIDRIREMLLRQKEEVGRRRQELQVIERKIDNRLRQLEDALHSELETVWLARNPERRAAVLKQELQPKSYLDLEYAIRQLEQEQENTVIFLGKVGLGISMERLLAGQFQPYDTVFILLDEEDEFRGETTLFPEEVCVAIRFQGEHKQAPRYYGQLMEYIKAHRYSICGFSKEITMIDNGLTDDPSRFVTEIQIPVS